MAFCLPRFTSNSALGCRRDRTDKLAASKQMHSGALQTLLLSGFFWPSVPDKPTLTSPPFLYSHSFTRHFLGLVHITFVKRTLYLLETLQLGITAPFPHLYTPKHPIHDHEDHSIHPSLCHHSIRIRSEPRIRLGKDSLPRRFHRRLRRRPRLIEMDRPNRHFLPRRTSTMGHRRSRNIHRKRQQRATSRQRRALDHSPEIQQWRVDERPNRNSLEQLQSPSRRESAGRSTNQNAQCHEHEWSGILACILGIGRCV